MSDEIPQVNVLLSDLQAVQAALNSAYHQNLGMDLVDMYRKLNQRNINSAMTKALQGALGMVEKYMKLAEQDDESIEK